MLAEYGNPEYIEPVRYEITGRTSSWGMNLGQVMSILAVVMVSVIVVVGAVMFFWNPVKKLTLNLPEGWKVRNAEGNLLRDIPGDSIVYIDGK